MKEKLQRSRKDKVIAGICGGLAEHFSIDPIIIRIIFIVLTVFHGSGILVYIVLWIVLPEETMEHYYARFVNKDTTPGAEPANQGDAGSVTPEMMNQFYPPKKSTSGGVIFGIILVLLGMLFFFWSVLPSFDLELYFPLLLVVIGAFLIFNFAKK